MADTEDKNSKRSGRPKRPPVLQEGELRVLQIIWEEEPVPAARVAHRLEEEVGWSRNTTYTLLHRCIEKGAVQRTNPRYICESRMSKEKVRRREIDRLTNQLFHESDNQLIDFLLRWKALPEENIAKIWELIGETPDDAI